MPAELAVRLRDPARRAVRFPAVAIGATFAAMACRATLGGTTWTFETLADLMAKASPPRSGDALAGIAASSAQHNVAAKTALADMPLKTFLSEALVPYETDDVTRLILDGHDAAAFAPVASLTVGEFRD